MGLLQEDMTFKMRLLEKKGELKCSLRPFVNNKLTGQRDRLH